MGFSSLANASHQRLYPISHSTSQDRLRSCGDVPASSRQSRLALHVRRSYFVPACPRQPGPGPGRLGPGRPGPTTPGTGPGRLGPGPVSNNPSPPTAAGLYGASIFGLSFDAFLPYTFYLYDDILGIVLARSLSNESVAPHFPRGISHSCPPPLLASWSHLLLLRRRHQELFAFPTNVLHIHAYLARCCQPCRRLLATKTSLSIDQTPSTITAQECRRRQRHIPFQRRCQGAIGRPHLASPRRRKQHRP